MIKDGDVRIGEIRVLVGPDPDRLPFPKNLLPLGIRGALAKSGEKVTCRIRPAEGYTYGAGQALDIAGNYEDLVGRRIVNGKQVIGRVELLVAGAKRVTIQI